MNRDDFLLQQQYERELEERRRREEEEKERQRLRWTEEPSIYISDTPPFVRVIYPSDMQKSVSEDRSASPAEIVSKMEVNPVSSPVRPRVFIVHGHDDAMKTKVANELYRWQL